MQRTALFISALIGAVVLVGILIFYSQQTSNQSNTFMGNESMMTDDVMNDDADQVTDDSESMMEDDSMMEESTESSVLPQTTGSTAPSESPIEEDIESQSPTTEAQPLETQLSYEGTYLSWGNSPVIDFNQSDFDAALAADKTIILYYYASWCPICQAEVPRFYSAMKQINDPQLVGFRVNFNDSDTDANEKDLARAHGIAYQHTKVLLQNGERILKSPQSWSEDDYLSQITPLIK